MQTYANVRIRSPNRTYMNIRNYGSHQVHIYVHEGLSLHSRFVGQWVCIVLYPIDLIESEVRVVANHSWVTNFANSNLMNSHSPLLGA